MGKRVSVRRNIAPDDGPGGSRAVYGDVIGELTAWADGVLTITRKDGSVTRVAERTLVAGKVVPPVPVRGPSALPVDVLQAVGDRAWPATEYAELGGWRLRAAGGFTRRANSVLPLGAPGIPLGEAVEYAEQWYAARELPTYFQVPEGSDADVFLAGAGWAAEALTLVRTARLAAVRDRVGPLPEAVDVVVAEGSAGPGGPDLPDDAWLARYNRALSSGRGAAAARAVLGGVGAAGGTSGSGAVVRHAFAAVRVPDRAVPVAIGRVSVDLGAVARPGGAGLRVASFTAMETDPAYRRRGFARAVMAALTDHALRAGATTALLAVEADNGDALRLYDGLGFTDHHRYRYRCHPKA
ncbi:GNAT family N-acetyltransferase [Yinghuangia sp. ASG 101]|uniref:GNAT family N-acetyltransferase n=1 Tax=Yinghuangia sp. ASG 101 TaxID=2896848 RepID=UPI001E312C8B|nr:GNAT family N-acetyltransferase [Yinghuangia sp. ASG 101]UGQ09469.1 GNAT family N-acetyltransferase [Yinghuangia sp. ASG 101]